MNKASKITAALPLGSPGAASPHSAAPDTFIADASKVSGRDFLDALGLSSPALRAARREQDINLCIAAINRGDTYGWPPVFVAEVTQMMAEEDSGWAKAERSALGMAVRS